MVVPRLHWSVALFAICILFVSGCTSPQARSVPSTGGPETLVTWIGQDGEPSGTLVRVGNLFAILVDFAGGATGGSSGNMDGIKSEGKFKLRSERWVAYHCFSLDGRRGEMEIDGQSFDLEAGRLFLVTSKLGETAIKQMDHDLTQLGSGHEDFQALRKTDTDIANFFEDETDPLD